MKRKIFYLIAFIFCINIITSTKKTAYTCYRKNNSIITNQNCKQKNNSVAKSGIEFDLSPVQFFVINI